ncbi:FMN-binding negative transcriptional regulator [Microcella daejeonensis]|uniref:FMN-binding negative transcriptional regulator n=1 Tax=Microcella daejeonensis TaxID=2994971 RepID=A0A9E8MJU7_9MICO|nr:FMN-binding negative transcriptional regulator [Microcella daejeonensis]WAB80889.1 FMN-binding negative transcriptional regulator [Microcella daejeonensis]
MRHTPQYLLTEPDEVRRLVRENPWAGIVSHVPDRGIVASHYPFLLDEAASTGDDIVLLSHVGRPDEQLHRLGESEVLVIVQGAHGYISPSWYAEGDIIPTWNHVTAHLYGTPEILSAEENLRVLSALTDHFEQHVAEPRGLHLDPEYSARVAKGTVGIRLRVTRFDARLKLSQGKTPEVRESIMTHLEGDGPYAHPGLAREMRRLDDHRDS